MEGEGEVNGWGQGVLVEILDPVGGNGQLILGYTGQKIAIQRQQWRGG